MQNYELNPAMANMVDLTRVVDFYCTAMENFEICRHAYGIEVHEVKYEDLIGDFVNTSSALLTFLGLRWEPQLENYRETALNRGHIHTPSYSQVTEPLYTDALYRWTKYEKYLTQHMVTLSSWISRYGYSMSKR